MVAGLQPRDTIGGGTFHACRLLVRYRVMDYDFLIDSYDSERVKVLSVWSEFRDEDLMVRPSQDDPRGRSIHEHMVHQCVSEDAWFRNMLGIDVAAPPLPERGDSTRVPHALRRGQRPPARSAAADGRSVVECVDDVLRCASIQGLGHDAAADATSHHRGQQMAMLRMLGRDLHSNYGPTADTGGLLQHRAPTIYAYPGLEALLEGERAGGAKAPLPAASAPAGVPLTERPAP